MIWCILKLFLLLNFTVSNFSVSQTQSLVLYCALLRSKPSPCSALRHPIVVSLPLKGSLSVETTIFFEYQKEFFVNVFNK